MKYMKSFSRHFLSGLLVLGISQTVSAQFGTPRQTTKFPSTLVPQRNNKITIPTKQLFPVRPQPNDPRIPIPPQFTKPVQRPQITIPPQQRNPGFLKPNGVLAFQMPDLTFAGANDLTVLGDTTPLEKRMWVKITNKGNVRANKIRVTSYFWKIIKTSDGKQRGVIGATRTVIISGLNPGVVTTHYPYNPSAVPFNPICYAVKIDPLNSIAETNEANNVYGRAFTTYPDYFLRQIPYDPVP